MVRGQWEKSMRTLVPNQQTESQEDGDGDEVGGGSQASRLQKDEESV